MVFEGGYYRARGDALKLGAANFVAPWIFELGAFECKVAHPKTGHSTKLS